MSTSHLQHLLNLDKLKGLWRQQLGVAKLTWGRLSNDELVQINGDEVKLVQLVRQHYGCTLENARKQVSIFFECQETCPFCHQTIFPIRNTDSRIVSHLV